MSPQSTAGYSGTPLPKKLGIKPAHRVGVVKAPKGFDETLGALPEAASLAPFRPGTAGRYEVLLLFARDVATLTKHLETVEKAMAETTALWICWPKKSSPLASDLDGNGVRERGLATGLVDIKVCAVDEDWSGLKFVYRVKDRSKKK